MKKTTHISFFLFFLFLFLVGCGNSQPTDNIVMLPNGDPVQTEVTAEPTEPLATSTEDIIITEAPITTDGAVTEPTAPPVTDDATPTVTVGVTDSVSVTATVTPMPTAVAITETPKVTLTHSPTNTPKPTATITPKPTSKPTTAPTAKPATPTPTSKPMATPTPTEAAVDWEPTVEDYIAYYQGMIGKKSSDGSIVCKVWIGPSQNKSIYPSYFDWREFINNDVSGTQWLSRKDCIVLIFTYNFTETAEIYNQYLVKEGKRAVEWNPPSEGMIQWMCLLLYASTYGDIHDAYSFSSDAEREEYDKIVGHNIEWKSRYEDSVIGPNCSVERSFKAWENSPGHYSSLIGFTNGITNGEYTEGEISFIFGKVSIEDKQNCEYVRDGKYTISNGYIGRIDGIYYIK